MCGIAGKLALTPGSAIDRQAVCAMTAALAHRGPHGCSHYFSSGIGLGYRQLAADATDGPAQPAGSEDGATRLVGDFALTNERELAAELRGLGHRVCGRGPADVVLHAYLEWGDEFVEHLRGAFACAAWDARRWRLLLARDPLGVKPLVYSTSGHSISFASEIKGLLQDPEVARDCDPEALQEFLAVRYVAAPATVLRSVSKLPSGHIAIAERGAVAVRQYWDVCTANDDSDRRHPHEPLATLLRDAVKADTKDARETILMLSGGTSSAVVGTVLADTASAPVVSVTADVDEAPFATLARAREVAKIVGSRHHAELSTPRLADLLPRLAWHLDEPCANPSAVTTYLACAAAAGPPGSRVLAGHGGRQIASAFSSPAGGFFRRARRAIGRNAVHEAAPGMTSWRRLRRALSREFVEQTCFTDPLDGLRALSAGCASRGRRHRARYLQVRAGLPDGILAPLDRLSAAVSLEVRLPLLDRSFVEAAQRLVALRRSSDDGAWLRQLSCRALPPRITAAQPEGVGSRVAGWLRGPLAPMISDVLLSGRFRHRGVFDHGAVTRLWQQHLTGQRDHHELLWPMLMLELWFQQFVDGASRSLRAA